MGAFLSALGRDGHVNTPRVAAMLDLTHVVCERDTFVVHDHATRAGLAWR